MQYLKRRAVINSNLDQESASIILGSALPESLRLTRHCNESDLAPGADHIIAHEIDLGPRDCINNEIIQAGGEAESDYTLTAHSKVKSNSFSNSI